MRPVWLHYTLGLVLALVFQLCVKNAVAGTPVADSLQQVLLKPLPDTQRVSVLNKLCWEYTYTDPEIALSYGQKALKLARENNFALGMAIAHNRIGVVYDVTSKYPAALEEYKQAISYYKSIGNKKGIASTLNNVGLIYWNLGAYDKALSHYLTSLKIFEEINMKVGIGNNYNNIGLIYMDLNNLEKALYYQLKALQIKQLTNERKGIASSYTNLGMIYSSKQEYDTALYYLEKSLEIKEEIQDNYGLGLCLNSMGLLYIKKGSFEKGMYYLRKSVAYKMMVNDKQGLANTYQDMEYAFTKFNYPDSALAYNLKALPLAKETGTHKVLYRIYQNLSDIYEAKGNYKLALDYAHKYSASKDSVLNEQKQKQLAELATNYETEKKENEIALLSRQKQIQQLKIKQQELLLNKRKTQIAIVIAGFVLFVIIVYMFYKQGKLHQKLLLDQEMLRQHKLRTKAVMEAEERERKRIGTELHDGLGQLLSVIKLNLTALQEETTNQPKQQNLLTSAINTVNETFKEVRQISHNMMPEVVQKKGLTTALEEYAARINQTEVVKVELEIIGLKNRIEVSLENTLYRVIQEIITNSLKHASATLIQVQIIQHDTELIVMIEDNGVGFEPEELSINDGIGIKNMYSRIECLNGEIHIDSALGRGTIFTIEIPTVPETNLQEV